MTSVLRQILLMVAGREITSQDGARLLAALKVGCPEESVLDREIDVVGRPDVCTEIEERAGRSATIVGREAPEVDRLPAEASTTAIETQGAERDGQSLSSPGETVESVLLERNELPPDPPTPEPPDELGRLADPETVLHGAIRVGDEIELANESDLLIESASPSYAANPYTLTIVGTSTHGLRVMAGLECRLRRQGPRYTLGWVGGDLVVAIPHVLNRLSLERLTGGVIVSGYHGPLQVEDVRGDLVIHDISTPFHIRDVQGSVRLLGLAVREGTSTISTQGADIEIEVAESASLTARVSSERGSVSQGPGPTTQAEAPRRGVWRFGSGSAQLGVQTVSGRVRIYRGTSPGEEERGHGTTA